MLSSLKLIADYQQTNEKQLFKGKKKMRKLQSCENCQFFNVINKWKIIMSFGGFFGKIVLKNRDFDAFSCKTPVKAFSNKEESYHTLCTDNMAKIMKL